MQFMLPSWKDWHVAAVLTAVTPLYPVVMIDRTLFPPMHRDYFEQYGNCETIYDTHTTRGGLVTYTVVLQFRLTDNANRVKQKSVASIGCKSTGCSLV